MSSSRRHGDVPASSAQHRLDYVELCPVALSSAQREAGEGQQGQWQEGGASGQWEAVLLRRGSGVGSTQRLRVEEQIERKWAEFERLPLKDVSSLAHVGQPASEALQREVVRGDDFPICKDNRANESFIGRDEAKLYLFRRGSHPE